MEFGVLGPVRVSSLDGAIDLGGARQRRLLAALIVHAGEVASTDRLLDIVFEGAPPEGASTTIRSYIARLRKALGDAEPEADQLIVTEQGGYSLRIDIDAIDAARFEASIEIARGQLAKRDPIGAAATLRLGLAMWRGDAYGEFTFEDWAQPEASRLEELKAVANEELNEALLACGLAHDVVSATRGQIGKHPLREKLRGQNMLALYRAGRQVEALRSLEDYQSELVEVGLEPSAELLRLGRSIASHDPALRLDSPAGQPLRGYRVGAALGEGAHGVVYRAVQPGVGREVAIKTIRAQLADDPDFVRRFDAEAQLVANLEHPHIVPIYDYWREPGGAYIVMRLLADNLDARLATGPMAVPAVATIARQLGSALAAAHRAGVVHGDIKPSNVLVDESSAYLADFGVATLVESAAGDATAHPSSGYESPELLAGEPPTAASDQFALAVLLVQLLSGQLPFGTRSIATPHDRSPSIHVQRPSFPALADEVIWKATSWVAADRYPDVETFIDYLEAALAGQAEPVQRDEEPVNPYQGLRAFTEVDRAEFFGRDGVVDELLDRLSQPGDDGRFVVAIGASGGGKSSVVRAGLLPRLRIGAVPGSDKWLIATMVPGSDPFGELDAAMRSVAASDPGPRSAEPDEMEVVRILDAAVPANQTVLLVIDQLEELFTQVNDETRRRNFVDGLTRAVRRPGANLRVVATLRADFLDRPLRYSEFGKLVKHGAVTVVGMSAPELESAITQPAAGVGVEVEPALSTQLVADVLDQPSALPLLEFTLTELFDRRAGPVLTLGGYRELGGVDAAVAGSAEAAFDRLNDAERELARRMFLRLVTVEESLTVSRRRALRSDVVSVADEPGSLDAVIEAFGAPRLLTFDRDQHTREPTVEIAHEALIAQWPRFGEWVASAGQGLWVQGQLAVATRTWEQHGRDEGDHYRGLRLESALEWADSQPEALNPLEKEFLAASVEGRAAEVEADRAQAERDHRTKRRLRGLLAGVGMLLIVALVAGALAIRQQRRADDEAAASRESATEAERQTEIAQESATEAERQTEVAAIAVDDADLATLISRSAAQSAENPELSVLLALEAHRRAPGPETEQAVLNALGSSDISNRVATFPDFDLGDCETDVYHSQDGLTAYAHAGGQLLMLDLTTGQITEQAMADEECGVWLGDLESGRTVAANSDGSRSWVGTFDDPYAVELEQAGQVGMVNTDLGSNVAAFIVDLGDGGAADDPFVPFDNPVVLFDATTGEQIGDPIGAGTFLSIAVDPSGSFVAVSHDDLDPTAKGGRVVVVDGETGAELFDLSTAAQVSDLTFDPTSLELIAGLISGQIMTIDVLTGEITSVVATTATSEVFAVGVRQDGLIVAVSLGQIQLVDRRSGPTGVAIELLDIGNVVVRVDGTVVTNVDNGYDLIEIDGSALVERSWPVDPFSRVAFNAGRAGLVNLADTEVSIVDLTTGENSPVTLLDSDGSRFDAFAVIPEPDGAWAVAPAGTMARWEGDTLVERFDFPGPLWGGTQSGAAIATFGLDADGNEIASLANLEHDAAGIVLTVPAPDTRVVHPALNGGLHVVDEDGTLYTYDSNGKITTKLETGVRLADTVTMEPTTGVLALIANPSEVVVIDPVAGEVDRIPGSGIAANVGFARDGQLLVITGFDGTVNVWDLDRGEPAGLVWDATGVSEFSSSWYDSSSDSMWVFTSGRLLEVPLDPQRWIERACEIVGRDLSIEEWNRYVPGTNDAEIGGMAPGPNSDLGPQSACS